MYNSVAVMYIHDLYLVPKQFYHLVFIKVVTSHAPSHLVITNLLSVFMELSIIDISYKWNHTLCDLISLSIFSVHAHCLKIQTL